MGAMTCLNSRVVRIRLLLKFCDKMTDKIKLAIMHKVMRVTTSAHIFIDNLNPFPTVEKFELTKQARAEAAMSESTHQGQVGIPGQGPHYFNQITAEHGNIQSIQFDSVPCSWSSAIGMIVAGFLEHAPVRDLIIRMSRDIVLERLRGIPGGKLKFVDLAMQAYRRLNEALTPTVVSHG